MQSSHTKARNITSVYWGFFSGGARNVHTDIMGELKLHGVNQRAITYYDVLDRGSEGIQHRNSDSNHQQLHNHEIEIASLGLTHEDTVDLYGNIDHFSGAENPDSPLEQVVRKLALTIADAPTDIILSLKEQPVNLLVLANRYLEEVLHRPAKPLVVTLHRTDPGFQDPKSFEVLKRLEHDPVSKKYITGYIGCSESAALSYQQALQLDGEDQRFTFVNNGIDLKRFSHKPAAKVQAFFARLLGEVDPPINSHTPIITIGARNSSEKNIGLFLQAACQFLQNHPTAHVVMCGSGMTEAGLNPLFNMSTKKLHLSTEAQSALKSRLHAVGRLSSDDISLLYSGSKVIALTSPTLGEADPLVLKEGMACGAIPVTTSTGDTARVMGVPHAQQHLLQEVESGFLVGSRGLLTSQSAGDIAHAWHYALRHRHDFEPAIKAYLPKIDKVSMGQKFEDALEHLLSNTRNAEQTPDTRVSSRHARLSESPLAENTIPPRGFCN